MLGGARNRFDAQFGVQFDARCLIVLLTLLLPAIAAPGVARAEIATGEFARDWYGELSADARIAIQRDLIWTGDYDGLLDGDIGPRSRRAVAAFQRRIGNRADGLLTDKEWPLLQERGTARRKEADWTLGNDRRSGTFLGLPYRWMSWLEDTPSGFIWANDEQTFRLTTFRLRDMDRGSVERFAASVFGDVTGFRRTYERLRYRAGQGALTVQGEDRTERLFLRAMHRDGELRGFFVWTAHALADERAHAVTAMANSLEWAEADATPQPTPSRGDDGPVAEARPESSGTAFAVGGGQTANETIGTATGGLFVTNAHVVAACGRITVGAWGDARLVHSDDGLDLAVLSVPGASVPVVASIADDDAVLAEDVYAFGFPLPETLGSSLGVSRGSVSSMQGMRSTEGQFRMTAAVQPGNSGGPLLDGEGRVVGVVTAKLNAMEIANRTGDIPQAMNFAIKASTLRAYLARHGLSVTARPRSGRMRPAPELAGEALGYTHQVLCFPR